MNPTPHDSDDVTQPSIHAHAMGDALVQSRPTDTDLGGSPDASFGRASKEGMSKPEGDHDFSDEEAALLRIFLEHRGQILTPENLIALLGETPDSAPTQGALATSVLPTPERITELVDALSARLALDPDRWQIRAVEGQGYTLWR